MTFAAALRCVRQSSVFTSRALLWSVLGAALVCAFFILALRYWFLPNIGAYRDDIAAAVSRAANVRITIGRISGEWEGIRPYLKLEDVTVYDKAGGRALELKRVDSTLAWRSLATLQLHFHALDIYGPALEVRRDSNGVFSVAGIAVEPRRPLRAARGLGFAGAARLTRASGARRSGFSRELLMLQAEQHRSAPSLL